MLYASLAPSLLFLLLKLPGWDRHVREGSTLMHSTHILKLTLIVQTSLLAKSLSPSSHRLNNPVHDRCGLQL